VKIIITNPDSLWDEDDLMHDAISEVTRSVLHRINLFADKVHLIEIIIWTTNRISFQVTMRFGREKFLLGQVFLDTIERSSFDDQIDHALDELMGPIFALIESKANVPSPAGKLLKEKLEQQFERV
jgi:hypothetical protein